MGRRKRQKALGALALLGAVTGASLLGAGAGLAEPPKWTCRDVIPGRSSPEDEARRCSYDVFPFEAPAFPARGFRPSPTPPYAS